MSTPWTGDAFDWSDLPRAVIFDVDGLLVDSERDGHRVAFNEAFAAHGLPYHWDEDHYGELLATTGGERRLHRFLTGQGHPEDEAAALAKALHGTKTETFRELCVRGRIPPRPGVQRLLDELEHAGVALAVATTGTRSWVEPLLEHAFGLDRFAVVLTGTEVTDRKPDPAVYHAALDRLGLGPADVVALEDSANGLAAARAAEVPCLIVTNDYTAGQDFGGAWLVVDAFGEPGRARVRAGPARAVGEGAVRAWTFTFRPEAGAGHPPQHRASGDTAI